MEHRPAPQGIVDSCATPCERRVPVVPDLAIKDSNELHLAEGELKMSECFP
jgi:hypothetical protein